MLGRSRLSCDDPSRLAYLPVTAIGQVAPLEKSSALAW